MTRERMTKCEKSRLNERCIAIVEDYASQGFRVTVRQVHYQVVSRFPEDYPNTPETYGRVQRMLKEGRETGSIDWQNIEDRTRSLDAPAHWDSPLDMIRSDSTVFRLDLWAGQQYRPEIWTEKQAATGIVLDLQDTYHLTLYSCRGFNSLSGAYSTRQRFERYLENGQTPIILYIGDCDPSGQIMDMGDNGIASHLPEGAVLERLALTPQQAAMRNLPPLPAKLSDSRTAGYIVRNGNAHCWELDALAPNEIQALITNRLTELIDRPIWDETVKRQLDGQRLLQKIYEDLL